MFTFIVQILLLMFSAYVFTPLFGTTDLGGVFRLIALAPYGLITLVLGLLITFVRFLMSCIFGKKISIFVNLIILILNIIIGLVFIL